MLDCCCRLPASLVTPAKRTANHQRGRKRSAVGPTPEHRLPLERSVEGSYMEANVSLDSVCEWTDGPPPCPCDQQKQG